MKSHSIVIVALFIALCVMNGCKQDKLPTEGSTIDQPPPPIGSGVLRANIDGSPWVAEDAAGIPSGTSTYSGNIIHISGVRSVAGDTAKSGTIDLIVDLGTSNAEIKPGTYQLGTIPAQEGEAQHRDAMSCACRTNSAHSGSITITVLDVDRKVVSGVFDFDGFGVDGQTHIVRGGTFDVTWK